MPMTVALADAPEEPQSLRQPTGLRLSTLIRASHQPGEKRAACRSNSSVELLNFMKKSASRPSPFVLCTDYVYGHAIPQGFRRTFVRARSWPTSANPVSRSEPAISALTNHRQRYGRSSRSTATSDPVVCGNPRFTMNRGFLRSKVPSVRMTEEDIVEWMALPPLIPGLPRDQRSPPATWTRAASTRREPISALIDRAVRSRDEDDRKSLDRD